MPLACALALLTACSPPAAPAAHDAPSAAPVTSERPGKLPPLPGADDPATTSSAAPAEEGSTRSCGTVTAASGARLQVIPGAGVTGCPEAERVVRAFHRAIAGRQPSGSRKPAAAQVHGWDCVSGPPSSQGGTICSRGGATISAAIVTNE